MGNYVLGCPKTNEIGRGVYLEAVARSQRAGGKTGRPVNRPSCSSIHPTIIMSFRQGESRVDFPRSSCAFIKSVTVALRVFASPSDKTCCRSMPMSLRIQPHFHLHASSLSVDRELQRHDKKSTQILNPYRLPTDSFASDGARIETFQVAFRRSTSCPHSSWKNLFI